MIGCFFLFAHKTHNDYLYNLNISFFQIVTCGESIQKQPPQEALNLWGNLQFLDLRQKHVHIVTKLKMMQCFICRIHKKYSRFIHTLAPCVPFILNQLTTLQHVFKLLHFVFFPLKSTPMPPKHLSSFVFLPYPHLMYTHIFLQRVIKISR